MNRLKSCLVNSVLPVSFLRANSFLLLLVVGCWLLDTRLDLKRTASIYSSIPEARSEEHSNECATLEKLTRHFVWHVFFRLALRNEGTGAIHGYDDMMGIHSLIAGSVWTNLNHRLEVQWIPTPWHENFAMRQESHLFSGGRKLKAVSTWLLFKLARLEQVISWVSWADWWGSWDTHDTRITTITHRMGFWIGIMQWIKVGTL